MTQNRGFGWRSRSQATVFSLPFSTYKGDGPFVFVCYANEDSDAVFREIAWLNDYGVNVWYDEGIGPGPEWREELASAIPGCTRMLFFVTPRSVVSEHCRRELNFAQEEIREVVAVHLEPTDMPAVHGGEDPTLRWVPVSGGGVAKATG